MKEKKKLLFLLPSLRGGGAERVAVNLIPFLVKYFDLTLILLEGKIEYELPQANFNLISISKELSSYKSHLLNTPFHIFKFYKLAKKLKPDVVLSFMEQANIINLFISKLLKYKVIVSQRIDPFNQYKRTNKGLISSLIVQSARWLYPNANKIICVSEGVKQATSKFYNISLSRLSVIPNPVDIKKIKKTIESYHTDFNQYFLVPGRFNILHKGQDLAIKAFAKVFNKYPNTKLILVGSGTDLDMLKELSKKLRVFDRVLFLGWRKDIWGLMSKAISTILPSRYEGWPNVLVEAMAAGSPVIATNCPHGPKEILDNGRFGMLVPMEDEDALANAMIEMSSSEEIRKHYKRLGQERAKEFDINFIGKRYVEEILRVLKK